MVSEKKKTKITFADKESENIQPTAHKDTSEPATANPLLDVNGPLQEIVNRTSSTCLQRAQDLENPSASHMKLLSTICNSFASRTLLRHLYSTHSSENENEIIDTSVNKALFQDILLPWTERIKERELSVQKIFTEGIVDILFMVYKLGSAGEKTDLLAVLCKVKSIDVLTKVFFFGNMFCTNFTGK